MAIQPITLQELNLLRHEGPTQDNGEYLEALGAVSSFRKLRIYWDFQFPYHLSRTAMFFSRPVFLVHACESRTRQAALVVVQHTLF